MDDKYRPLKDINLLDIISFISPWIISQLLFVKIDNIVGWTVAFIIVLGNTYLMHTIVKPKDFKIQLKNGYTTLNQLDISILNVILIGPIFAFFNIVPRIRSIFGGAIMSAIFFIAYSPLILNYRKDK